MAVIRSPQVNSWAFVILIPGAGDSRLLSHTYLGAGWVSLVQGGGGGSGLVQQGVSRQPTDPVSLSSVRNIPSHSEL